MDADLTGSAVAGQPGYGVPDGVLDQLRAMEPDDRAAIEEALTFPEESAGRLMQRDLIAVPEHWNVGQVIDYLRSDEELATDFFEIFVVDPAHRPVADPARRHDRHACTRPRSSRRDLHAGEDVGQRARQLDLGEELPA